MPYCTALTLAVFTLWGQKLEWADLPTVALLVVLEGVLSIDNALVLGLLAKRLPKFEQNRALTYGLVGAFVFRFVAVATAAWLIRWRWVKLLGGGYLLYIALKHLFFEAQEKHTDTVVVGPHGEPMLLDEATGKPLTPEQEELEIEERVPIYLDPVKRKALGFAAFWPTVVVIELTDIAFAVDSILAAIALVSGGDHGHAHGAEGSASTAVTETAAVVAGAHPKLWVVILGGMLGVLLMRVAAFMFITLLEKFPRFESAAYLLVCVIGLKLLGDWYFNVPGQPAQLDFHHANSPWFWAFWGAMLVCFLVGFIPRPSAGTKPSA